MWFPVRGHSKNFAHARAQHQELLLNILETLLRYTIYSLILMQEPLPQRIQQDIVTELRTPEKLRESLDVVDIVLGMLSSGGGSHTVMLEKYISTRRMGRSFSAKVGTEQRRYDM